MPIPKIIHQIAPKDKSKWHPLWFKCQESWLKHFPDFEYKLWNDEEDIDNFVKNNFDDFKNIYLDFPVHIMKIDFARFCILYHCGGIYADMDMFCYKNFYNNLKKDAAILESPYGDTFLENALMVSSKHCKFFMSCIEKSVSRYSTNFKKQLLVGGFSLKNQKIVTAISGPDLVSSVFRSYDKNDVDSLSGLYYNNHGLSYHPSYFTKHLLTGIWGREIINYYSQKNNNLSFQETVSKSYLEEVSKFANLNISSLDNFDFYRDYTNGGFLKKLNLDTDKNNIDNDPNLDSKFLYN